jgi:trk system potassium uptake protein TrkH
MDWFDAVNHSLTTLPTGGFSTHDASIGYFDSIAVETIVIAFMFIGGINFTLLWFIKEGEIKKAFGDEEFRYYLIYILVATLAIAAALIGSGTGIGTSLRHSLFHVVSIGTSSGFVTTNYRDYSNGGDWPLVTHLIIFVLMIVGASAGSTAGGLKLLRVTLAFKVAMRELVKIAQPRKIDQIRMNGEVVERNQIGLIVGMLIVWVGLFGLSSIILAIFMPDNTFESVITVVASSLGNTGPALGEYGPHDTWASMNSGALIITSILMWFGRLELLTAVILIHPHTWRKEEKVQSDRSAIALYRRLMEDDDKD